VRCNALLADGPVVHHGAGIFLKIQKALSRQDLRAAVLELVKSTHYRRDPLTQLSGILFSSRVWLNTEKQVRHHNDCGGRQGITRQQRIACTTKGEES